MYRVNSDSTSLEFIPSLGKEAASGLKSILFLGYNILTLGIYASSTHVIKRREIRELEKEQRDLQCQLSDLNRQFDGIERELTHLMNEVLLQLNSNTWNQQCDAISLKIDQVESSKPYYRIAKSLSDVSIDVFAFIGELFSNVCTLGLHGFYHYAGLNHRFQVLEQENSILRAKFVELEKNRKSVAKDLLKNCQNAIQVSERLKGIEGTDPAKAYDEVLASKKTIQTLNANLQIIQQEVTAKKAQTAKFEADLQTVREQHKQILGEKIFYEDYANQLQQVNGLLQKDKGTLQKEIAAKNQQLQTEQQKAKSEQADLQVKLNIAKQQAQKVAQLELQIANMALAQKNQPEIAKLAPKLGLVPPRYVKGSKDNVILGAMDLDEHQNSMGEDKIELFKNYNECYGSLTSAADIMHAAFNEACDSLFDSDIPIEINCSAETIATPGMLVVYNAMVYNLLVGAKLDENGCHGFQLKINGNVTMLPSKPERILRYKPDGQNGLKPIIKVHYQQRDDFTPDEETLGTQDGVDPVSAKWILEQLSDQEKHFLMIHLCASLISSDHQEYKSMRAFMEKKDDPRVKLVATASDLIQDIASAIKMKFEKTVLISPYQERFNDWDVEPFVKPEEDQRVLNNIADTNLIESSEGLKENWVLDDDVIGDRDSFGNIRQQDFLELIQQSRRSYASVLAYMGPDLLVDPQQPKKEFKKLTWKEINPHFYVSHEIIGAQISMYMGIQTMYDGDEEKCLFSNLLAILVTDKKYLTKANVQKLRNAMAAYLGKLQKARTSYLLKRNYSDPSFREELEKLEKLATLFNEFEKAILETHQCKVDQYQNWLRRANHNVANINLDRLTPFEIQLAAYTIGVKIALIPFGINANAAVDKYGRILPGDTVFGPNTEEVLMMGAGNDSYYGLFPKIQIDNHESLNEDDDAIGSAVAITNYWESIDINKKNQ